MPRLSYLVLIFFFCKSRGSRMDLISRTEQEVSLFGNTAHVLESQRVRSIRAAKSQGDSSSSGAFCASFTVGISDTILNAYIQDLLSEVIKQLLPLDLMKSLPKTIKDINKLLKGREDPNINGHLKNNDMLKLIQSMTHLAIARIIFLPMLMRFSPDDVVHLSLPVEIDIEGKSTENGFFAASVKVKVDIIAKLLWEPSKDQIFITEVSKISINEIQVKQEKSVADPAKKNMQFMLWTILIDVINQCTQLVADLLNVSLLSMLASAAPVGTFEAIQYDLTGSPTVTEKHFLIPYQEKQLMTTALTSAIPKMSEHFPAPQPLVIQTRGSRFPLVSMDSQNIKVKQGLFTDVLVHGQPVLHLEVSIIFQARLSASNGKLFISLSQNRFDIVRASSSVGSTNAQKLYEYISDIHTNSLQPAMNGNSGGATQFSEPSYCFQGDCYDSLDRDTILNDDGGLVISV